MTRISSESGEPVHEWFGSSYADYLVVPRTLIQSILQPGTHPNRAKEPDVSDLDRCILCELENQRYLRWRREFHRPAPPMTR